MVMQRRLVDVQVATDRNQSRAGRQESGNPDTDLSLSAKQLTGIWTSMDSCGAHHAVDQF